MYTKSTQRKSRRPNHRRLAFEPLEARRLLATFVVNNVGDNFGINPLPGDDTGTLRQAIVDANSSVGADDIVFNIGGGGLQTITPFSALPTIAGPTNIDATTQPGFAGSPIIELSGTSAGGGVDGLRISASNSVLRGLIINRFSGDGVEVTGSDNVIAGNWIGVTAAGNVGAGNGTGVFFAGARNTLGGTTAADRNVISASVGRGVGIIGAGATDNVVSGNYIGLDATGTASLGNGGDGIRVQNGTSATNQVTGRNTIGGAAPGAGNVIAGSGAEGLTIVFTKDCTVQGNYVGTNAAGTVAFSNNLGIFMNQSSNNLVGGTAAGAGNLVSGNRNNGISVLGSSATQTAASGNTVQGNFVGTQAGGTGVLGNRNFGINFSTLANNNTAGGTLAAARNVVCNNGAGGVNLIGSGNTIQGNWLGIDAAGNAAGNVLRGIDIPGSNNLIGGTAAGAANRIANTITAAAPGVGVRIGAAGTGNRISRNSIFNNGSIGIDLLLPAGVNPNDPQDPDFGGNRLQNYPLISSVVTSGGSTTIQGRLRSTPFATFTIEFFRNQVGDPSGFGEGETFIGDTIVTTDSFGNASFSVTFAAVPAGEVITSTATDSNGNTSEFSGTGAPLANHDFYIVAEDGTLVANDPDGTATVDPNDNGVLANDIDPDDDSLTATVVSGPVNGNLSFNTDGTFSYTPFADFFGSDSFTYIANDGQSASNVAIVFINVSEVNDAPVAVDDSAATTQDLPVSGNVLSNDTDPDNTDGYPGNEDALFASLVTGPAHGTLVLDYWTGDFTYTPSTGYFGTDSFTYQAVDSDGAPSNLATVTITVAAAQPGSVYLVPDACNPGEAALVVNGTEFDDDIHISPSSGGLVVTVNGVSQGPFNPTGRIVVFGYAGNDTVQLAGTVPNEAWLYGDSGNDSLNLANGGGIAFGGDGNDHLLGGNGRDVLVGGDGVDRLVGNSGDDILIASLTIYDDRFTSASHEAAWCAIYHEWTREDHSYQQRVDNITDGTGTFDPENGSFFLNSTTVLDDDDADQLTGAAARDWFFANLDGLGAHDVITDLKNDEFADELSL